MVFSVRRSMYVLASIEVESTVYSPHCESEINVLRTTLDAYVRTVRTHSTYDAYDAFIKFICHHFFHLQGSDPGRSKDLRVLFLIYVLRMLPCT